MSRVNNLVRGDVIATQEQGMALATQISRKIADIYLKETPVPTVLYDRDAPPYFDDLGKESKIFYKLINKLEAKIYVIMCYAVYMWICDCLQLVSC